MPRNTWGLQLTLYSGKYHWRQRTWKLHELIAILRLYPRLNMTVKYAQECCSVLATILNTNYMRLGHGSIVYTTISIIDAVDLNYSRVWVMEAFFGEFLDTIPRLKWCEGTTCNALHIFIPCSCVPPRTIKSPATVLWLHSTRLRPTLSAFMILYARYEYTDEPKLGCMQIYHTSSLDMRQILFTTTNFNYTKRKIRQWQEMTAMGIQEVMNNE